MGGVGSMAAQAYTAGPLGFSPRIVRLLPIRASGTGTRLRRFSAPKTFARQGHQGGKHGFD